MFDLAKNPSTFYSEPISTEYVAQIVAENDFNNSCLPDFKHTPTVRSRYKTPSPLLDPE